MPYGCGEQNMISMVPSIFVLKYFTATRTGSDAIKAKATQYIQRGYHRELTYRHGDGSFSAFGTSDSHGSTWLTAFVVRSFYEAAEFYSGVDIDGVVTHAVNFLYSQQDSVSGCFNERGRVLSTSMQGGVGHSSKLALTAYVLSALSVHMRLSIMDKQKCERALQAGVRCLVEGDFLSQSNYLLALTTYALSDMYVSLKHFHLFCINLYIMLCFT